MLAFLVFCLPYEHFFGWMKVFLNQPINYLIKSTIWFKKRSKNSSNFIPNLFLYIVFARTKHLWMIYKYYLIPFYKRCSRIRVSKVKTFAMQFSAKYVEEYMNFNLMMLKNSRTCSGKMNFLRYSILLPDYSYGYFVLRIGLGPAWCSRGLPLCIYWHWGDRPFFRPLDA